jgi:hypothetical protein
MQAEAVIQSVVGLCRMVTQWRGAWRIQDVVAYTGAANTEYRVGIEKFVSAHEHVSDERIRAFFLTLK